MELSGVTAERNEELMLNWKVAVKQKEEDILATSM